MNASSLHTIPPARSAEQCIVSGGNWSIRHTPEKTIHIIYLAVIAVLIIVIVYVGTWAIRANRMMKAVEDSFGLNRTIRSSLPRDEPLREITVEELLRERTFDEYQKEVDFIIERALELGEFGKGGKLSDACAYALRGGKRLRPIITLDICRAATIQHRDKDPDTTPLVDPANAALFIEYLHTSSLIIDDLPAFDDDIERRGKASVHAMTNPAVAQMAALSLVSAAFQDICRQIDWIRNNCPEFKNVDRIGTRLSYDVSRAIGVLGAAGGQFMDSSLSESELFDQYGSDAVLKIMQLKTATFFEIAFLTGWLISGSSPAEAEDLQRAGRYFGTAFQIADDIGDMAQDAARHASGKPGWNFANQYGEEEARHIVTQNLNACRLILQDKKIFSPLWQEIYDKVLDMTRS